MKLKRNITKSERAWAEKRLKTLEAVLTSTIEQYGAVSVEARHLRKEIRKLTKWLKTGKRYKIDSNDAKLLVFIFVLSGSVGVLALFLTRWIFG